MKVILLERIAPFWWPLPTQNPYFFTFHSSVCSYGYIKKYVLWVGATELFAVETWSIPFPPFDSETFWLLIWNSDRSCAEISLSETSVTTNLPDPIMHLVFFVLGVHKHWVPPWFFFRSCRESEESWVYSEMLALSSSLRHRFFFFFCIIHFKIL